MNLALLVQVFQDDAQVHVGDKFDIEVFADLSQVDGSLVMPDLILELGESFEHHGLLLLCDLVAGVIHGCFDDLVGLFVILADVHL